MSPRVLFVDDERSVCEWGAAGLGRRGFSVLWRTSAAEALDELESTDFDVIVADLNMPGIHGIDFCKRIAANRADVPVIVITARTEVADQARAISMGVADYVTKPFSVADVLARINLVLRRDGSRSHAEL